MGGGVDFRVYTIIADVNGNLYAGGGFANMNIARWDGYSWNELMQGFSPVYAFAMDDKSNLYSGGGYGYTGNQIKKWEGGARSYLGGGVFDGVIGALTIDHSGNLYAGGSFARIDGKVSAYIAKCTLPNTAPRPHVAGNPPRQFITFAPGTGLLGFYLQSATGCGYSIYTLTGKRISTVSKLLTKENNSLRIDNSRLVPGVYVVQASAAEKRALFKMVVRK